MTKPVSMLNKLKYLLKYVYKLNPLSLPAKIEPKKRTINRHTHIPNTPNFQNVSANDNSPAISFFIILYPLFVFLLFHYAFFYKASKKLSPLTSGDIYC